MYVYIFTLIPSTKMYIAIIEYLYRTKEEKKKIQGETEFIKQFFEKS